MKKQILVNPINLAFNFNVAVGELLDLWIKDFKAY
jgi:hypothetical protein